MPARFNPVQLFSGTGSRYLAEKIAGAYGAPLGELTFSRFSDGEFQPSYNESIRGSDIFIIQSTFQSNDNLMELLLAIDAAKRASAHYITAVIPYFGYARQDRKDKPRVSIGAKLHATLVEAAGAHRVMTMDLHAPQIQGFFNVVVDHLDSSVIFVPYIKSLNLENLTIASPDMGGSQRARFFAKNLEAEIVICDKHRKRANQVGEMRLIGDVADRNVVIVDDLIDTAGTITKAADLMLQEGAKSVRAFATHPVLSGPAYERIENSNLEELVVCDTIPLKDNAKRNKIRVLTVAPLFAKAIHHVYEHGSISSLFSLSDSYQKMLDL